MNSTELYLTACRKKSICVPWPCQFSMSSQTWNLRFTTCFKIQNSVIQDPIVLTTQLTKSLSLSLIRNNIYCCSIIHPVSLSQIIAAFSHRLLSTNKQYPDSKQTHEFDNRIFHKFKLPHHTNLQCLHSIFSWS